MYIKPGAGGGGGGGGTLAGGGGGGTDADGGGGGGGGPPAVVTAGSPALGATSGTNSGSSGMETLLNTDGAMDGPVSAPYIKSSATSIKT